MSRYIDATGPGRSTIQRIAKKTFVIAALLVMAQACGTDESSTSSGPDSSDDAGIEVSEASGSTSETGEQAEFTVVLAAQPTGPVTVLFDSSDRSEGVVERSSLTFSRDNWDAPQTVTVTGVDDDEADGDREYAIVFGETVSADEGYAGLVPDDVALSNLDDETPGFRVTEPSGPTTEAGGQASFSVALNTRPSADVTVSLASADPSEGTASQSTLTFTSDNWNAPQTVTVTGVDDDITDGDQVYAIAFEETSSDDEHYAAIRPDDVELTNIDDESAGFRLTAPTGPTTEAGEQASFDVVLNSEPTADVILSFDVDDATEGRLDINSLTFTPDNWSAPQTISVTGVDDDMADGNQRYHVVFAATQSDDESYAAVKPVDVELTNVDDETAGVAVGPASDPTTEAGGQATFDVVLSSQPSDDVTVRFDTDDASEGVPNLTSLTFTADNWNAAQTVAVTGVDDDLVDGNQRFGIVFSDTESNDEDYAAITPSRVHFTNIDDDSAGTTVSAISGETSEAGADATFDVVLNSEPTADVTLTFDTTDSSEGTVSPALLTFTSQDWDTPQTVVVSGVDDDVADGDQPYAVRFQPASSADTDYDGLTPPDVTVTNLDDDSAGITVSDPSGPTTESGGQATFDVVLTSVPSGDVTVTLWSDDTTEATVDTSSLTFTPQNWDTAQTVTVNGVDDDVDDGDQSFTVSFGAPSSTDAAYRAVRVPSLSMTNTDDDTAGFVVAPTSGTTTEDGGQFSFTVELTSEPTDDVTVSLSSSDTSEGTVDTNSLSYTPETWDSPQTVTVTGQSDSSADGDQSYTIVFGTTSSNDADYAAIQPTDVQVVNQDTTVVTTCDSSTEVDYNGKCYYLDGSGGSCQSGYTLAPQSVLNTIAGNFVGKTYKTTTSNNCCIWHSNQSSERQDWGMGSGDCNQAGTFQSGPVLGGAGCTDALQTYSEQLTLCMSQ